MASIKIIFKSVAQVPEHSPLNPICPSPLPSCGLRALPSSGLLICRSFGLPAPQPDSRVSPLCSLLSPAALSSFGVAPGA